MASPELLPPPTTIEESRIRRLAVLRRLDFCSSMLELRQHHSQVVRLGHSSDNDAVGRLLRFCAISPAGDFPYALRLSQLLPHPDPYIFNTLLRSSSLSSPLLLYTQMLIRSVNPNNFTFPSILKSLCSAGDVRSLAAGIQVHAHVLKLGFLHDTFSQNNLINLYFASSLPVDARRVFDKMPHRDVVSWTTMITGLCRQGLVEDARNLFDTMPERNSISWNAMISGYVQNESFQQAFELFSLMQDNGFELDKYAAASMLAACGGLGALEQGRWIHKRIERNKIELDSKLATTILDMYCKCGCLEMAYEVFDGLNPKGISSWNCMIGGLGIHGRGEEAINLFKEMEREKVRPDDITLLNLLSACAHAGLVDQGRHFFNHMVRVHEIEPKPEHFGCLVDLLGRAGLLLEAKMVIDQMPTEPNASALGALLGACRIHGDVELGEQIGQQAIDLDPKNSGRYILLANIYAGAGRWDEMANVRRLMNDRGVKKEAGWSIIEKNGVLHKFIAGGKSHPETSQIYTMVDEMIKRISQVGYAPEIGGVLNDFENLDGKESSTIFHSEKLAIAFGLLHTKQGETIRISKNLRVCRDCHSASKLISKVYDRKIIVRDRNRFHHFYEGQCSCKDYW